MKTFGALMVAVTVLSGSIVSYAQRGESGVPGDNFSLEGALELFKKSQSPEEFERMLNAEDSKVNNLDLNGDGYIDYIKVIDRQHRNVHAFVLQAVVSETEDQDVAVIELEKLANGKAVLQIVGDEDVFGVETIIEPTREVRTYAGATHTPAVVNVWVWPSVQYVYGPHYSRWSSPWGWHRRPMWWQTWRPVSYHHYYSIWHPYRPYYSACNTHRVVYAHHMYRPYRTTSVFVYNRHRSDLAYYRSEHHDRSRHNDRYRNGRTRTDDRQSYNRQYTGTDQTKETGRVRREISRNNSEQSLRRTPNQHRTVNPEFNGRSPRQREVPASPNVSAPRQQPLRHELQQSTPDVSRDNFNTRRSGSIDNDNYQRRPQVTRPGPEVRTPRENMEVQRRPTPNVRSMPAERHRSSDGVRMDSRPAENSTGTVRSNRERPQVGRPATERRSAEEVHRSSGRTGATRTRGGQ